METSMIELHNKTVIVTGAGAGIGKAITLKCLECGAEVIACDINGDSLNSLGAGLSTTALQKFLVDVSDYNAVEHFINNLFSLRTDINCLVNNAGIYFGKGIMEYTPEMISKVIDINIKGAVYFSKLFGKYIVQRKQTGAIVNISSVAGQEGSSDAVYGLSKAALIGLTKSCAMNFSPYVKVNAIAPTIIETDLLKNIPQWRLEEYREKELIKAALRPDDVANTTAFLLSDLASHYTGSVFDINNGCYMR